MSASGPSGPLVMYISQVKCLELRICSFFVNSNLKKSNSFAHLVGQGTHHHGKTWKTWKMDKINSMQGKIKEFQKLEKQLLK